MMKAITCLYCGVEGTIGTHGLHDDKSLNIFKHLGHNHVSGHLHFQCPVCEIVLLVDPALPLANDPIFARESLPHQGMSAESTYDFSVTNTKPSSSMRI